MLGVELLLLPRIEDRPSRFGIRRGVRVATGLVVLLALTKRVRERFDEAGIELSSATSEQYVRLPDWSPQSDS